MHVSNVQVGTPFYMDPSTRATGRSSSASDVFSFGVIMWELFCGRPPYVPDNTGGVVKAPDFPSFPPGTPPIFVNLALQCLSIKPSERPSFTQCQEVLQGLQNHLLAQIAHCQNQQLQ
ncbi:kinase-like domain-containing protein [Dunaliella salina]|uniref:Kinase-like domain-containing protein n=1 Tax=Dunaliella salina TaxID=3046 RepID=A0ABQ7GVW8_DUNSA|nr:kinase-like domain-containing protein [Dunaliella salina]|eukprot:KAF5838759.1 kinase-like domain-containing protein [Dunaliella salina]